MLYVTSGDTFFTRSNTLLGRLIRFGETDKGEAKGSSWTNHTGVVVEDGWIGAEPQAVVIEALWHTRKGPLVLAKDQQVRVFRPIPAYDAEELARFRREAETYVGDKYGWWKLLVQFADKSLFGGKKVLTTALYVKGRPICSFLAGHVNHVAQSNIRVSNRVLNGLRNGEAMYSFGTPPQAADPDEMMDFCLTHPALWEEVK
jgi:hypothetical protein